MEGTLRSTVSNSELSTEEVRCLAQDLTASSAELGPHFWTPSPVLIPLTQANFFLQVTSIAVSFRNNPDSVPTLLPSPLYGVEGKSCAIQVFLCYPHSGRGRTFARRAPRSTLQLYQDSPLLSTFLQFTACKTPFWASTRASSKGM